MTELETRFRAGALARAALVLGAPALALGCATHPELVRLPNGDYQLQCRAPLTDCLALASQACPDHGYDIAKGQEQRGRVGAPPYDEEVVRSSATVRCRQATPLFGADPNVPPHEPEPSASASPSNASPLSASSPSASPPNASPSSASPPSASPPSAPPPNAPPPNASPPNASPPSASPSNASPSNASPSSSSPPNDAPRCVPGTSQACASVTGCSGAQVCAADGRSFGPCVCTASGAG